jgi:hypothetical protein
VISLSSLATLPRTFRPVDLPARAARQREGAAVVGLLEEGLTVIAVGVASRRLLPMNAPFSNIATMVRNRQWVSRRDPTGSATRTT